MRVAIKRLLLGGLGLIYGRCRADTYKNCVSESIP